VLMHECGHGSLFRSGRLNRSFGFVFGVLCGMPQHVWSQHHQFHHAHNGNWNRYRGPLNIAEVAEYTAMSHAQQRRYRRSRSVWLAPMGGFMYMVVHPRWSWLKGSVGLLRHLLAGASVPHRARRSPCWRGTIHRATGARCRNGGT
jgi:omega-6 fatty acid desaturase (delta-12 desaturase)